MSQLGVLLGGGYQEPSVKQKEVPAILKPRPQVSTQMIKSVETFRDKFNAIDVEKFVGKESTASEAKGSTAKTRAPRKLKPTVSVDPKVGRIHTALYTSISEDGIAKIKMGDGAANVLAKIINAMKRHHREMTLRREIASNFLEERHAKEQREMMNLLSDVKKQKYSKEGATTLKKQDTNDENKKKTKDPWWKKKLKEIALKIVRQTPEIVGGFAGYIAGQYDYMMNKFDEYSKKVSGFLNISPKSTATRSNQSIREFIGQKESEGNYNIMNAVGKNPKESMVVRGNIDVTTGQPFQKDLTDMTMGEVYDLGVRRKKHYKGLGGEAAGKYQFVPSTLADNAKKVFGDNWKNEKFSSENQEKLMDKFEEIRNATFAKQNIPLTKESAYLYHLSPQRASEILKADPNTLMSKFFNAMEIKENPKIASQTVGEYRRILQSQIQSQEKKYTNNTTTASMPTVELKSILDMISRENEELKKAFKESITAIVDESTKIINSITQNQVNVTEETPMSDIPTVLTK